jgi:hypothetical protein
VPRWLCAAASRTCSSAVRRRGVAKSSVAPVVHADTATDAEPWQLPAGRVTLKSYTRKYVANADEPLGTVASDLYALGRSVERVIEVQHVLPLSVASSLSVCRRCWYCNHCCSCWTFALVMCGRCRVAIAGCMCDTGVRREYRQGRTSGVAAIRQRDGGAWWSPQDAEGGVQCAAAVHTYVLA